MVYYMFSICNYVISRDNLYNVICINYRDKNEEMLIHPHSKLDGGVLRPERPGVSCAWKRQRLYW